MTGTWRFTGIGSGRELTFDSSDGDVRVETPGGWVLIAPAALPRIVAALYEAAGQPEPVILERPEGIDAALSQPDGTFSAGSYAFAVHDGRIDMTGPVHCMLAEEAEFVAGALAVYAAVVRRDEPDPAEVEELAEEIRQAVDARIAEARDGFEIAARAALRWMKDKQQQEGSRDG